MLKFTLNKIPFNDEADAMTIGPIIFVTTRYKDDISIIKHEKFHVKMFWVWTFPTIVFAFLAAVIGYITFWTAIPLAFTGFALRAIAYYFIETYRLWEEIRAYIIQLGPKVTNPILRRHAKILKTNYRIKKISEYEIYERLINERENHS